jgi:hypothetical protein
MNNKNEVTIPITPAFEKRLAEMVWENLPELARQTVAGKIAMALEVDEKTTQKLIDNELKTAIGDLIEKQKLALDERLTDRIDAYCRNNLDAVVGKSIRDAVEFVLNKTSLSVAVDTMIRDAVREEVAKTINSWLTGDNKQAMTALVDGRVDNYIRDRTESKVEHWLEAQSRLKMAKIVADRVDAYIGRVVVKEEVERSVSDAKATEEPESAANQSGRGNDGSRVLEVPAGEPAAGESQVGSDQQACPERLQESQPER